MEKADAYGCDKIEANIDKQCRKLETCANVCSHLLLVHIMQYTIIHIRVYRISCINNNRGFATEYYRELVY